MSAQPEDAKAIACPRHGGPWGQDETCLTCTDEQMNPRPLTYYNIRIIVPAAHDGDIEEKIQHIADLAIHSSIMPLGVDTTIESDIYPEQT